MKDRIILGVLLAVLVGTAAVWFFANYEKVEVEERTAPAPEVRANRYFGFFSYLETHGITGENIYNLNTRAQLPPTTDTIIFNADASSLTAAERADVLDWVAEGGQLLLQQLVFATNELLMDLGVDEDSQPSSIVIDSAPAAGAGSAAEPDDPADRLADQLSARDAPVHLIYSGATELGELEFPHLMLLPPTTYQPVLWSMSTAPATPVSATGSLFAYGFPYGLGFVTVLGEHQLINNDYFHLRDNSFIMRKILTSSRDPGTVWIVSSVTRPDLWNLVWWRSAHLILWGALGVVLFFWWAGHRFGPLLPDPPAARREFYEHLAAGGRFLWRMHQQDELLRKTRDNLLHKLNRRYPHLRTADASEHREALEKSLGDNIRLWDFAMQQHTVISKHQFVAQVKALQTLRELL